MDTEVNLPLRTGYEEYRVECEGVLDKTLSEINALRRSILLRSPYAPFEQPRGRIKTLNSCLRKCERKGFAKTIDSIRRNIFDIVGIRIITLFPDDIDRTFGLLKSLPGLNVEEVEDYVANPKPNGYRSLHVMVKREIFSPIIGATRLIPMEIQIRCKSMDYWATIEHRLKYKRDHGEYPPEAEEIFKRTAEMLIQIDDMFVNLRNTDDSETVRNSSDYFGINLNRDTAISDDNCSEEYGASPD